MLYPTELRRRITDRNRTGDTDGQVAFHVCQDGNHAGTPRGHADLGRAAETTFRGLLRASACSNQKYPEGIEPSSFGHTAMQTLPDCE